MTSLPLPSIHYPGGLQLLTSEALHAHRHQAPGSAAVTRQPLHVLATTIMSPALPPAPTSLLQLFSSLGPGRLGPQEHGHPN